MINTKDELQVPVLNLYITLEERYKSRDLDIKIQKRFFNSHEPISCYSADCHRVTDSIILSIMLLVKLSNTNISCFQ